MLKKKNIEAILVVVLIVASFASMFGLSFLFSTINSSSNSIVESNNDEWTIVVDGLVINSLNLTYDDLLAMPSKTVTAKLWCVDDPTGLSAHTYDWTGVSLKYVLEIAGVSVNAEKIALYAADGYSTDLTLETALRSGADIIIAYKRDGKFISKTDEGFPPLQLVVPGKYGYKWIKYLTHIEVVNYDYLGTYERRGYSDEADLPK
ncbi:MAG: molybdopterin-dependent oxidoreductase [Promethearchaeota archaeon]